MTKSALSNVFTDVDMVFAAVRFLRRLRLRVCVGSSSRRNHSRLLGERRSWKLKGSGKTYQNLM